MRLQPLLRLCNVFVVVRTVCFILVGRSTKAATNFRRELVLDGTGDGTAKPILYDMHHQVGNGVDAAHAVYIVTLGDQVATL